MLFPNLLNALSINHHFVQKAIVPLLWLVKAVAPLLSLATAIASLLSLVSAIVPLLSLVWANLLSVKVLLGYVNNQPTN